jgi:hypothetical protein
MNSPRLMPRETPLALVRSSTCHSDLTLERVHPQCLANMSCVYYPSL